MVAVHPVQTQVAGGPLKEVTNLSGGWSHHRRAAGTVGAERGLPNWNASTRGRPKCATSDTQHFDHVEIRNRRGISEVVDDVTGAEVQQHGGR